MDLWCGHYRMKPGADVKEYADWSRTLEQEVMDLIPGLHAFQIYAIQQVDSPDQLPHWDVVETAEIDDWTVWGPSWETNPRLQEIWQQFLKYIEPDSLTVLFGRKA